MHLPSKQDVGGSSPSGRASFSGYRQARLRPVAPASRFIAKSRSGKRRRLVPGVGAGDRGLSGARGLAEADVDELEAAVEGAADDDQDDRGHDAENGQQPGVRGRSIRVEASSPSHGTIQSADARWPP